eukprot:260881-Rhodomonas_salina.2
MGATLAFMQATLAMTEAVPAFLEASLPFVEAMRARCCRLCQRQCHFQLRSMAIAELFSSRSPHVQLLAGGGVGAANNGGSAGAAIYGGNADVCVCVCVAGGCRVGGGCVRAAAGHPSRGAAP